MKSPSTIFSTVTSVVSAAPAITFRSRLRPTKTLPRLSAMVAWNIAISVLIAFSAATRSPGAKGFSTSAQSSRWAIRSDPISPRSVQKGCPFAPACTAA